MINTNILFIVLISLSSHTFGQELINNSGFENCNNCRKVEGNALYNQENLIKWTNPTKGRILYYYYGKKNEVKHKIGKSVILSLGNSGFSYIGLVMDDNPSLNIEVSKFVPTPHTFKYLLEVFLTAAYSCISLKDLI